MTDLSLRLPDPASFGPDYLAQTLAAQRGRQTGQRDFLGARLGRGPSFINALQRRDAEIRKDVTSLRAHSRHLDNNNPWYRNYLRMMETDTVGPKGFTLQARVRKPGSDDLWEEVNNTLETAFKAWSQKGVCTVDGRHSFLGVKRLTGRTLPCDGEVFIREVFGFNNGWGYALQLLDADLLDVAYNQEPGNGRNAIVMGTELDSWGRPIRYWFRPSNTAYSNAYPNGDGKRFPIPAEQIIHVCDPERMNQTRGVPFAAPVMYLIAMLGAYLENELAASRFETERFMMLENPEGLGDFKEAQAVGAKIVSAGLHAQVLPPGYKATAPDLRHPNANLPPYVATMLHAMAAGLGVSHHGLTRDPSEANYTATRADDMVDRPQKQRLQGVLVETMLERVYRNWLQMAYLAGKIKLPAQVTLDMAAEHRWTARGWVLLDPLKDRQADVLGINNGLTTRSRIVGEEGESLEDIVKGLAYEQALFEKHGVKLTPTTVLTVPADSEDKSSKKGETDAASA
jgi:lambda family phage portal protein